MVKEFNHKRRKELLKTIISNLVDIYNKDDKALEVIPMQKLNSINISVFDFLKWMRIGYRERSFTNQVFLFK
jgi:hypothetical protein